MSSVGVASSGGSVRLVSACSTIFAFLLIYYALGRFTGVDYEAATQILPPQIQYVLLTIPIVAIGAVFAVLGFVNGTVRTSEWLLLIYLTAVMIVSALRADFAIIPSTIAFVMPLMGIWALGLAPSPSLLNGLIYFLLPLGALSFLVGQNQWGVIPGFANDEIPWRVSIFPGVADTAYFCVAIIIANVWFSNGALRRVTTGLAAFFLLFTVIRSAAIGMMMALIYLWLAGKRSFSTTFRRWLLITAMVVGFIILILLPAFLSLLLPPDSNIPFINQFLFHSEEGVQGAKGLSETVYRGWLWVQHISIFVQHPLFGIGSYDLNDLVDDRILGNQHDYAGTESLLTGLLSRVGLLALFLFAAIIAKLHQAVKLGEHAAAASGIAMIVMLISHGGLANTYSIEFLLLASGLNWRTGLMSRLTGKRVSDAPG